MSNIDLKRTAQDLVIPVCMLALVIFLQPFAERLLPVNTGFEILAISLLLIPAFLSLKFKHFPEFYFVLSTLLILAGLHTVNEQLLPLDEQTASTLKKWLVVFLPLNFLLIKTFRMPGLFTTSSRWFIAILALETGALLWLHSKNLFSSVNFLLQPQIQLPFTINESVSQLALFLFLVGIAFQLVTLSLRNSSIQSSLLGGLLLTGVAINSMELPHMLTLYIIALGITLSIGIAQDSHDMAFMDALTRLPGRRSMEQELKKLGKRYCIAMLDIDHFKKLNDKYGHDVGDQVLKMVAKNIKRVSGGGKPARYGGEEFVIIFPGKTLLDVIPHLESVRMHIENTPFVLRDKDRPKKMPKGLSGKSNKPHNSISVTVSLGVAERTRVDRSTDKVMKAADNALYKAKKQGRNQICY